MSIAVVVALVVSLVLYVRIGWGLRGGTRHLSDLIPIQSGRQASVHTAGEFSASTVATTVSLATIIVAYFELVPALGFWLLWTAITTAVGILLLALASGAIWRRMAEFDHRPTLHEFLGRTFASGLVAWVGAVCTSIGFLLIFAVELTVGARFLASMLPGVPMWLTVVLLSFVGFLYTALGGFRAVVRTDVLQMRFIWLFILGLLLFIGAELLAGRGSLARVPRHLYTFPYSDSLLAFLVGIALMNIPTHLSNMSIWQRIAASDNPRTVALGVWQSVAGASLSWGGLVLLAVLSYTVVRPVGGENLLITLLKYVDGSPLGHLVVFLATLGLYGAMLSTASTQLIVVSHTIQKDILPLWPAGPNGQSASGELRQNRLILFVSAVVAVLLVELLNASGFSVADLVFAIYGGQLSLFPLIVAALVLGQGTLRRLRFWANLAAASGFVAGWASAFVGKALDQAQWVFLAPVVSIAVASGLLLAGWLGRVVARWVARKIG